MIRTRSAGLVGIMIPSRMCCPRACALPGGAEVRVRP
jgi:hypothetical protein